MVCAFTCPIFAFTNQIWIIFLVLGVFEKFENRLAGQKRGLPTFSGLADLAAPKIGFRQCIFRATQKWPNGPDRTQFRVPSVYLQDSASFPANFFLAFDISTSTQQQIILFRYKPIPYSVLSTLGSFSSYRTHRKPFPAKFQNYP